MTDPLEAKAKVEGHRRKCSPKKKVFKNFFQATSTWKNQKKGCLQIFRKISGVFLRNFNGLKKVLSSSRGQGNFRGLEVLRPRPRTSKYVLEAGAPRAERGPGASSNVTELWFCKVQNRRRKCCCLVRKMKWSPKKKKNNNNKGLLRNFNGFFGRNQVISRWNKAIHVRLQRAFYFSMSFGWTPQLHGPRGHCPPCPPSCRFCLEAKDVLEDSTCGFHLQLFDFRSYGIMIIWCKKTTDFSKETITILAYSGTYLGGH